jgi:hypothetical protein
MTSKTTNKFSPEVRALAVRREFGHLSPGAARGLALRHDHGSNLNRAGFPGGSNFQVEWSHDEQDDEQVQP